MIFFSLFLKFLDDFKHAKDQGQNLLHYRWVHGYGDIACCISQVSCPHLFLPIGFS